MERMQRLQEFETVDAASMEQAALDALRESEERYRILVEHTLEGIFVFDLTSGLILDANPAYLRMLGYERSGLVGRTLYDVVDDTPAGIDGAVARVRRGEVFLSERRHRRQNGTFVDVEVSATLLPARGVQIGCAVVHDISARKRQQQLERDRSRALEMVAKNQPLDETLSHLVSMVERQRGDVSCVIELGPRTAGSESGPGTWVAQILSGSGEPRGALVALCRPPRLPTPEDLVLLETASKLAGVAIDQKELTDRLAWQAQHDELTGLPNRRLFEERLRQALSAARQKGQGLALLGIDLDRFKQVNDTLGHSLGDRLLRIVAKKLENAVRPGDLIARMGGDEFTIIATDLTDPRHVSQVADRLLAVMREPIEVDGYELFVTGSIGISTFPQDGTDAATLQRSADIAMYRAKALGRNAFQTFTAELNAAAAERLALETLLRRALENQEIDVHFQPEVSFSRGLVGFEALIRWNHPRLGSVPPSKFIPVAEESGLVVPLGTWVLREACRQLAAWGRLAAGLRMAVNVSPVQFVQADLVEMVASAVQESGVEPHRLELELTESMVMRDYESSSQKLTQLRQLGVSIAIDDFGTGYSSLSHLHRLPIDTLKIDQSFVRELRPVGGSRPLVDAVVALARSLDLSVVAEGVETPEQLSMLATAGCERVQGYLLGRARSGAETERLLALPETWRAPAL